MGLRAEGFCSDCGDVHFLEEGEAKNHALKLFKQLESSARIDFENSNPDPVFSTDYLFGEARGQMFGVLHCEDSLGNDKFYR